MKITFSRKLSKSVTYNTTATYADALWEIQPEDIEIDKEGRKYINIKSFCENFQCECDWESNINGEELTSDAADSLDDYFNDESAAFAYKRFREYTETLLRNRGYTVQNGRAYPPE